MTKPKFCKCGCQKVRHAGWEREGRCNVCRPKDVCPFYRPATDAD